MMKTKKEELKLIAKQGFCKNLICTECPYNENGCSRLHGSGLNWRLAKIGAMAILRQNRKKRGFDLNKVLTCITADKAKAGMRGYFADSLQELEALYNSKADTWELAKVLNYEWSSRFMDKMNHSYSLFCPIDEVEE